MREDWSRIAGTPQARLVAFADALPERTAADVVIAPADDFEGPGRVLAGLRYACLRRDFWEPPAREVEGPASTVLVTMGSGDGGGLAGRIAAALAERFPDAGIELVRGPGFEGDLPPGVRALERPRSLREALLRAAVVVCAGGQTMLEAAASGAPAVVVEAAANQRTQIAALAAREAVLAVVEEEAPGAVARLLATPSLRAELARRGQEAVDGRGAPRVAAELAN